MDEITASIGDGDVLIYTKNDCVNCESTKELMDQLKISYTVINMDKEPSARATVKGMGFRQAPVVVTRSAKWSGHKEASIRGLKAPSASDSALDDDIWA